MNARLAGSGTNGRTKRNLPEISQEVLAEMVGTTRSRISYFMTKFRKLGLIDYSRDFASVRNLRAFCAEKIGSYCLLFFRLGQLRLVG
jgi:hypothetical protein